MGQLPHQVELNGEPHDVQLYLQAWDAVRRLRAHNLPTDPDLLMLVGIDKLREKLNEVDVGLLARILQEGPLRQAYCALLNDRGDDYDF